MAYRLIVNQTLPTSYRGDAEVCTWEFTLPFEQLPGVGYVRDKIIDAHICELRNQGSELLRLRVWEDTSPIFVTKYRVETTAAASPLWWNLIIMGVLAILFIVAIAFAIKEVRKIIWDGDGNGIGKWLLVALGVVAVVVVVKKRKA